MLGVEVGNSVLGLNVRVALVGKVGLADVGTATGAEVDGDNVLGEPVKIPLVGTSVLG